MKNLRHRFIYSSMVTDVIFIVTCFILAAKWSHRGLNPFDGYFIFVLSLAWYFSSKMSHLYDEFRTLQFIDEFLVFVPSILVQYLCSVLIQFSLNEHHYQRVFSVLYPTLLFLSLAIKRYLLKKYFQYLRINGLNTKNILIIGTGENAMHFWKMIKKNTQFGYNVVGFIDEENRTNLHSLYKGGLNDLDAAFDKLSIDEVIVADQQYSTNQIQNFIEISDKHAVRARIIPNYFQLNTNRFKMEMFGDYPLVTVRNEPLEEFHSSTIKRIVDILFSLFVIITVFSWLFPIIALLIKLDSKGPVFFIQDRWGKGNKSFRCFKFRTMYVQNDEKGAKFQQTTKDDPRITRIGAILRKTNLDELPQFFNVVLGDMSVVGPRPHAVKHNLETKDNIDGYLIRHWVKPGITGWAQANGYRGETSDLSLMKKRVDFDIWYIENWTPWLDLKIIFMTIYSMVKGDIMAY